MILAPHYGPGGPITYRTASFSTEKSSPKIDS